MKKKLDSFYLYYMGWIKTKNHLTLSNGKSSIVEEQILRFVFVPSIVEEQILRFVFVPSIVKEQILWFVFLPSDSLGTNKFVVLRPFDS
jgi:hypothetical protein